MGGSKKKQAGQLQITFVIVRFGIVVLTGIQNEKFTL